MRINTSVGALSAARSLGMVQDAVQKSSETLSSGFRINHASDDAAGLGLAAGASAGLNVAGTINGVAGTGNGQLLTGAAGDAAEGLAIRYSGTTARAAGTVRFTLGVMGTLGQLTSRMASETGSTSDAQVASLTARADALDLRTTCARPAHDLRTTDIQARLDARREALTKQFIAMESAIARANAIGSSLASQITSLQQQTR